MVCTLLDSWIPIRTLPLLFCTKAKRKLIGYNLTVIETSKEIVDVEK